MGILRRFVTVGDRVVHLRIAGSGPAAVLLHQTPQSSVTMEPLMARLTGFTAIAIDTPGFGLSDPLPGADWPIPRLAEALRDTLDALGLGRVALLGQHTGATIAAEFAVRWPDRVACLAADGFTAFTPDEARTILPHQLAPFAPATDGSHLAWAWSRFRDGWMFFPWSDRRLARRRAVDMPAPAVIQSWQVMELLRSGESHRAVYPGVFGWDGVAAARALRGPALLAATAEDQLADHLDRLTDLPQGVWLARFPSGARAQILDAMAAFCAEHVRGADPAPAALTDPAPEAGSRGFVRLADGRHIAFRRLGAGAPGWLLLHGAGSASECEAARWSGGPAVAIDLPGHGESDPAAGMAPAVLAGDVAACLDALGLGRVSLRGRGLGAAVAAELAILRPDAVSGVRLGELAIWSPAERAAWEAARPDIAPRWDGTHLLTLWHALRDAQVFWPWFDRRAAAARRVEPALDARSLAAGYFAALRCADLAAAERAWLDWPAAARLAALPCPAGIAAVPGDGWARDAAALAAACPSGRVLDADPAGDGLTA
jgi:pimeloyl-ACP methyl ester carboxylesterase